MESNCNRNARDTIFERLGCPTLLFWFGAMINEQVDHKMLHLCKAEEVLLPSIRSSGKIDMSQLRTPTSNKLHLEASISSQEAIAGVVDDPLLQSPATQTSEALCFFRSDLVLTMFKDFTKHLQNKLAGMQGGAKMEGTILSVARVGNCIVTVTYHLTDNYVRGGLRQKL